MALSIGIITETADAELRVALTPDVVKKIIGLGGPLGLNIKVQRGAGQRAFYADHDYINSGAEIVDQAADVLKTADILLSVQIPSPHLLELLPTGALVIGLINPHQTSEIIEQCTRQNLTLIAMEQIPRITRAQAMDVLSSQSNLAGYRAVIEAAAFYGRAMPMMMTAAGTIAAARVFIMGAGVAGLQAIATARRLGAIVSATDVRLAAKEQVASLGAQFVMVEDDETAAAETAGGYAREMSEAYRQKQATLIAETIQKQDIIITTALIPGKPAPRLVTRAMITTMKPGSVIVDMAVESGGNVEGSVMGETVIQNGVTIIGFPNLPARIATDASALYARNLLAFMGLILPHEATSITINLEDDILKKVTITHQGKVIHPQFQNE